MDPGIASSSLAGVTLCETPAERTHARSSHDSLAEWYKALAQGDDPQRRGCEPRSCHFSRRVASGRSAKRPVCPRVQGGTYDPLQVIARGYEPHS